jgi:hypothetical protein
MCRTGEAGQANAGHSLNKEMVFMSQPPPDQDESFALIIDTSSNLDSDLDEARQTAYRIYSLTGAEQFKIFTLGSTTPIQPATLKQPSASSVNQQARPCSLIAPIMEVLVRQEQKHSVIIVGSGEIFDLDDWVGDPRVDGWLLVLIGEQLSLQGPGRRITEIKAYQVSDDIDTLLNHFSRFTPEAAEPTSRTSYHGAYKWQVDASGYPLIFVETLEAYVHLFPVTKPQFEKFIASGRQLGLDDEWYEKLRALNPRASYRSSDVLALEQLFMTGISTDEAISFGRWLGRDYKLLSAEDWRVCYEWFDERPAPSPPPDVAERMSRDALAIWHIIEGQWLEQQRQINLRELSLMKQGILEWIVELPGKYYGLGDPATAKSLRKFSDPVRLLGAEPRRHKNLGFRLRMR